MAVRAIVFDFDGVIANSEPLHFRAFRDVLADAGVTLTESDYYARYLGYDDAGAFTAVGSDQSRSWTAAEVHSLCVRKAERLEQLEQDGSVLFPGARDAVVRLASQCPIAIASGARRDEIVRVLEREALTEFFAAVVSAEDTVAGKPAPDPYLRAVRQLAMTAGGNLHAAECVAVEDSRWGLESARAAGLKTVAVTHTYPAETLVADLVIAHLDALTWNQLIAL